MTRLLLAAVTLVGCVDAPNFDDSTQAIESANGVSLNGVSLNGVSLNGVSLNGVSLNGVSLNGVSLNGVSLDGVSLNGVSLNGVSLNGSSLTGVRNDTGDALTIDAVGTTMYATLSNGEMLALHVDSAEQLAGANSDVWSYGISYESDEGTSPLCGDAETGALAIAGTWNTQAGVGGGGAYTASSTSFTFACRGKSIAKCVELGYKTWLGYSAQMQSCVRMLRGDYCGDGTPYTVTGQTINLYDNVGVQADTQRWIPEAEWTPNGARCISTKYATRFNEFGFAPTCTLKRGFATYSCGTSFKYGAVLIDEVPPEIFETMATNLNPQF